MLQENKDTTIFVERSSSIAFFSVALFLFISNIGIGDNSYFMIIALFVIGLFQGIGSTYKYELIILRIVMSWVASLLCTWLLFTTLNNFLSIPALYIGGINIYNFVILTSRTNIAWLNFFQE